MGQYSEFALFDVALDGGLEMSAHRACLLIVLLAVQPRSGVDSSLAALVAVCDLADSGLLER